MWLACMAALAGDLVVATPDNAEVYVDRAVVPSHRMAGQHVARGLEPGMHEIEIRVGRRMVDNLWVEVPYDARVRVEWATGPTGAVFSVFAPEQGPTRPTHPSRPTRPGQPSRPGVPLPPQGPQPMPPDAFASFLAQVDASSFDSGKMGMLETAAAHNVFTAQQLAALLRTFDFDSKRADAACTMAPRVIDPQNAHVIGNTFDFGNKRNDALACFR